MPGSASRVRAFFAAFAASQSLSASELLERLPMKRGAPAIKPAALSDTVLGRQRMFSRPEIARFYALRPRRLSRARGQRLGLGHDSRRSAEEPGG